MNSSAVQPSSSLRTARQLIWLYFWLLIFEGSLRKWILPGYSNILLVVRDPVVIAIYVVAIKARLFPRNGFISTIIALAGLNLLAAMIVNPTHPLVTAYGLRANFLHLFLVFVIPRVFTMEDVRQIGRWVLLLALPMAFLVYRQFTSPSDARINAGAGLDSMQIESAYDKIRPAGTFSFSNGLLAYLSLTACFLFYGFFWAKAYPKWLMIAAVPSLFLMVMLSGSRSVLSSMTIMVGAAVAISIFRPKLMAGSLKALVAVSCVYLAVGSWTVIREGAQVLDYRLVGGGGIQVGLVERYLDSLLPLGAMQNAAFLGSGVGMGTNAAAGLLTGARTFLLAESEWDRVILESGVLLGGAYLLILRIGITLYAGQRALAQLRRGETLGTLLFAAVGLQFLTGQFAQPAALGFGVLGAGLCLAACAPQVEESAPPPPPEIPKQLTIRSRSVHSEALNRASGAANQSPTA